MAGTVMIRRCFNDEVVAMATRGHWAGPGGGQQVRRGRRVRPAAITQSQAAAAASAADAAAVAAVAATATTTTDAVTVPSLPPPPPSTFPPFSPLSIHDTRFLRRERTLASSMRTAM
ncbi:hypothetical protein Trydic_g12704 [Trypoxylus dichotomus]